MAKLVSKTYGDALFELALEENKIDMLLDEVNFVKGIIDSDDDFVKMMNHPQISREEKDKFVEDIFKGKLSDDMVGFLKILIFNGRFSDIESVFEYFIARVKDYKKIGVVYVTTPLELSAKQKSDIEKRLLETTEYESMEMNYSIDESLIGGMTIRIKDRVIDSSIKSKISKLKLELMNVKLQ